LEEGLIKKLMTSLKCTVCGRYYEASAVDVLGHEEDLWFLKASCKACHAEFLVAAVIQESREFEPVKDITTAESVRFEKMGKLTADDVLDMHRFLKDFDGNFSRIFQGGKI
jgi:hypothetical protein